MLSTKIFAFAAFLATTSLVTALPLQVVDVNAGVKVGGSSHHQPLLDLGALVDIGDREGRPIIDLGALLDLGRIIKAGVEAKVGRRSDVSEEIEARSLIDLGLDAEVGHHQIVDVDANVLGAPTGGEREYRNGNGDGRHHHDVLDLGAKVGLGGSPIIGVKANVGRSA